MSSGLFLTIGTLGLAHPTSSHATSITGRSFFSHLTEQSFALGLHLASDFAAGATLIAVIASMLRGRRYVHGMSVARFGRGDGAGGGRGRPSGAAVTGR